MVSNGASGSSVSSHRAMMRPSSEIMGRLPGSVLVSRGIMYVDVRKI